MKSESKKLKQLQSELTNAKEQLKSLERSVVFSDYDKSILRPKWEDTIKTLQNRYDTEKAKQIKVNEPTSENGI